ncbi:Forkhead associated (FHA) domain, binds pSer, pThr, pTyr [Amycolatopsis lurida]|uniref:Phosphopeptide-binding protein n=1 Tax=Amycolatopsis lurida NRRL 2430 TaxID=1460371 RepID=A0A2P2FTU8_AMYLU|nr:phosphopeptide-binding protein [Amycolatopsis lurida NRRL 2430]SEC62041.1 Forkhead associated (FHA) domain, binds pSer, pThr, pTyr [Amycolatopsis lurida]
MVASQCDSLNLLSFLPDAGHQVSTALLDPEIGGCVPALEDGRGLLVDPTMVELDDALVEAFERASEDEATLFLSLVGHGEYADDDFYFLTKDTGLPVDSRRSFLFAQRIKELLGRYSTLDGLVILLDTCHAGIGARQAGQRWLRIVGEAGKRFDLLTASDDRVAANGCFSRSLVSVLRSGHAEFGERVRCADLKRVITGLCPMQTAIHLGFDGTREVTEADQGLWLALNSSPAWRRSPLAGNPAAPRIERLTANYRQDPKLGETVGRLLTGARLVAITGEAGAGKSTMLAALARPSVAGSYVPPDFLHGVLFASRGDTAERLARELARQLRRTVPGFAEAEQAHHAGLDDAVRSGASVFDLALLGPLRTLAPQWTGAPVRIAIDGLDDLDPDVRERLYGLVRSLATDPGLELVTTVVATRDPARLPPAAEVPLILTGGFEPPGGGWPTVDPRPAPVTREPEHIGGWGGQDTGSPTSPRITPATLIIDVPGQPPAHHELSFGLTTLGRSRNAAIRLGDSRVSRLHCKIRWDGTNAWLTDLDSANGTFVNGQRVPAATLAHGDVLRLGDSTVTFISVTQVDDPEDEDMSDVEPGTGAVASPRPGHAVLLDLLTLAATRGPIPISILTAASAAAGGPDRRVHVRDFLAGLGDSVSRTRAGLADETVLWTSDAPALSPDTVTRLHARLAAATSEVALVAGDDEPTLEQGYAVANEAEHFWLAGLREDALVALERRASHIPVENRERWAAWAKRAERELGETDRMTLRCKARHATWTGKAGDAAAALARFEELLPIATATLSSGDEEVLSIRHNVGYLRMELGRFEESRAAFEALVRDATHALGAGHRETLHARHLLAVATGKTGKGEEALRLSRELLPQAKQALGDDEIVGHVRHNIAFWSAEIEQPPPRRFGVSTAPRRSEGTAE